MICFIPQERTRELQDSLSARRWNGAVLCCADELVQKREGWLRHHRFMNWIFVTFFVICNTVLYLLLSNAKEIYFSFIFWIFSGFIAIRLLSFMSCDFRDHEVMFVISNIEKRFVFLFLFFQGRGLIRLPRRRKSTWTWTWCTRNLLRTRVSKTSWLGVCRLMLITCTIALTRPFMVRMMVNCYNNKSQWNNQRKPKKKIIKKKIIKTGDVIRPKSTFVKRLWFSDTGVAFVAAQTVTSSEQWSLSSSWTSCKNQFILNPETHPYIMVSSM
jgi:hypothetical protein